MDTPCPSAVHESTKWRLHFSWPQVFLKDDDGEGISTGQLFEQFLYIEHRQYAVHPFTMNENNSAEPTSISIECNLNALSLSGNFERSPGSKPSAFISHVSSSSFFDRNYNRVKSDDAQGHDGAQEMMYKRTTGRRASQCMTKLRGKIS